MPVKQRTAKRHAFSEYHLEQLLAGPDAALLAGVGYLAGRLDGRNAANVDQLTDDQRGEMLEDMRADWQRHGAVIMAWLNGEADRPPVALKPWQIDRGSIGGEPWALAQFGLPA